MSETRESDLYPVWDVVGVQTKSWFFFRFGSEVDQAVFRAMRYLAMIDAVWVPILVSFGQLGKFAEGIHHPTVIAADVGLNCIYGLGALLQLRMSAVDLSTASEYVSPSSVFWFRIRSPQFWMDFLSLFGIFWCVAPSFHLIACVRLFRCWRVSAGSDDLYELHLAELTSEDPGVNFVVLLVQLTLIIHAFTCTWFFASTMSSDSWEEELDSDPRFADHTFYSFYQNYFAQGSRMMAGWGSPAPVTQRDEWSYCVPEYIFLSLLAPLSSIYTARILAQFMEVVEQGHKCTAVHVDKLAELASVLDSLTFPASLRRRCLSYCSFLSIHNASRDEYEELVDVLSDQLKEEIKISLFEGFVRGAAFFRMIPEEVLKRLILSFEEVTYAPFFDVITQGGAGNELYFVLRGSMEVFVDGVMVKQLEGGAHFGELALLYDMPRSSTITTTSFCMCAVLSRDKFQEVLDKEPLVKLCIIRAIVPNSPAPSYTSTGGSSATGLLPQEGFVGFNRDDFTLAALEDTAGHVTNARLFEKPDDGHHAKDGNRDLHDVSAEVARMCASLETHLERIGTVDERVCRLEQQFKRL